MGNFYFWGPQNLLSSIFDPTTETPNWLRHINSIEELRKEFSGSSEPKLLFVTEDILKKEAQGLMDLKNQIPKVQYVYINQNENTQTKIELLKNVQVVNHLLPIHSSITKSLFKRVLQEDWRKIFLESPEKIFQPENLISQETLQFRHVDECQIAFEKVKEFLANESCFSGFSEMMVTAASELLTNVFYNAPRDKDGNPRVFDRKIKFELSPDELVQFSFGKSDGYFWMSVSDRFGTLDRQTLINAMNRAATERTAKQTAGGAGLGLIMLFEWASEIGFNLDQGVSTTVACRFKLSKRQKEFDMEPSVFHVFAN